MKKTYKIIPYELKFNGEIWECITKCPIKIENVGIGSLACQACENFIQDHYDNEQHTGYIKCKRKN